MNIPEQIKVGPFRFRVLADSAEAVKMKVESGQAERIGETHRHRLTIVVDPGLAPDMIAESLLHEVMHAVFTVIPTNEKLTEERFIQLIAPTLLGVLRENPDFVAYVTSEEPIESPRRIPIVSNGVHG